MIPLEQALRIVDETLAEVRLPSETVPVRGALGRTLRSDEVSRLDLPPFDKSAMDGYAVLAGDDREEYSVLGIVAAGDVGRLRLAPGTAVKVMTGAPVPEGTGRVIMVEHARERDGVITVRKHATPSNICLKAEDVRRGETILRAGTVLGPVEIANLVSCGVTEVEVAARVRVAVISTGDEIVDSPEQLGPGKIMNANGPLLTALCRTFALEVVREVSLADEPSATVSGVRAALEDADVVVASGGVSVGDFDYVLDALAEAGLDLHFSRVAVKPGKPTVFASARGKVFFGLPGNPVSVYVMFHLFVLRALARMTGGALPVREFKLRMGRRFERGKTVRTEFVPCRLTSRGAVEPVAYHGSAHLTALAHADGFFVVPVGTARVDEGDEVVFVPLRRISKW